MKNWTDCSLGSRRRPCWALWLGSSLVIVAATAFAPAPAARADEVASEEVAGPPRAFKTTVGYVTQFYPLWFTYYQAAVGTTNHLAGPNRVSPLYKIVVAINHDTLYASAFLDVAAQPAILTIPATSATYSILVLDPY